MFLLGIASKWDLTIVIKKDIGAINKHACPTFEVHLIAKNNLLIDEISFFKIIYLE